MFKSSYAILFTTVVAVLSQGVRASEKPISEVRSIAVLPLTAKSPSDSKQATVLDDLLLSALQGVAKGVRVVGQSDMDRLLGFERVKDAVGCDDVTCAVEIAGALGVDSLVYGSVGRLGRKHVLSLTWIDQRDGHVLGRDSEVVDSDEQLIDGIGIAVAKLFGAAPVKSSRVPEAASKPVDSSVRAPATAFAPLSPPVPERSKAGNLALNASGRGFPSPLESDAGWGGGARPWDIVDGRRTYGDEWAHGLAFVGGTCGVRSAVLDFGARRRFNRAIVWHHGRDQVPSKFRVQVWDGGAWSDVLATDRATDLLAFQSSSPQQWWESWSVPMDIKLPVTYGSKVRFAFDNCGTPHGWIYEIEIYDESETTPALQDPNKLSCWLPTGGTWYEKDRAIYGMGGHLIFPEELGDYRFAATAEIVSGLDTVVGFLSRVAAPGAKDQGYATNIIFGGRKLNIFRGVNGSWFLANPAWQTWTFVENINAKVNRVVWESVGPRHRVTLNGKPLYEFIDGGTPRGRPGFWVENPATLVRISDIELQRL